MTRTSAPAWTSAGARGQHALFDQLIESALLARSPFNNSGDFRHALAEVAGGCEFLLVDTRRVGTSGGARAESSSAAHDDHLIVEHDIDTNSDMSSRIGATSFISCHSNVQPHRICED